MIVHISDLNVVAESEAALFSVVGQSSSNLTAILSNQGSNTINYRWQYYDTSSSTWVDMVDAPDNVLYGTLMAGQVRAITVSSSYAQVRVVGSASGGSMLLFSIDRVVNRASGGPLPLVSYGA